MLALGPRCVGRVGITSTLTHACSSTTSLAGRRAFSTTGISARPTPAGFFARPTTSGSSSNVGSVASRLPRQRQQYDVAVPHSPPNVPKDQAPNYPTTWSETQNPRQEAMKGPRFEQMTMDLQPRPLSAMEMIQREPIRLTHQRVVECDGGDGALGHPRVFINLDKPGPKGCPYCGLRYERIVAHH